MKGFHLNQKHICLEAKLNLCKMKSLLCRNAFTASQKPYIALIFVQFAYAGMALFSKAAIAKGMNPFVFVVYRQAFASLALSPFAFFLERLLMRITCYYFASFRAISILYASLLIIFPLNYLQPKCLTFIILLSVQDFLGFIIWVCNNNSLASV